MTVEPVFGIHAVQAILEADVDRVEELLLLEGRGDSRIEKLRRLAENKRVQITQLSRKELDKIGPGVHQGVVARVRASIVQDENALKKLVKDTQGPITLLVLDGVTDPHNLGACLRTAEAAGVHAVIQPRDNSAGLTPVVRKVACGAAEIVPVIAVTNLARTLRWLQQEGIWLVGADGEAEMCVDDCDMRGAIALIMGAEGRGMRRLTRDCCDFLVRIPMMGSLSSLNVSVSAGICLFEMVRQRKTAK